MAASRISLWYNGAGNGGNLHLVFVDEWTGLPYEYIQTPNNVWGTKNVVPQSNRFPDRFLALKLVQGIGSVVMLIALDTGGALWYTTSNDNGVWAPDFAPLPNIGNVSFTCFDAVWNVNEGIVVVASGPGPPPGQGPVAYTQSTQDGVTWSQPSAGAGGTGWSNLPNPSSSYSYIVGTGITLGVDQYYPAFPPAFSNVAISNNGPVHEEDSAPVIAGLEVGGLAVGSWNVFPLVLYTDTDSNWQWSSVPSIPDVVTSGRYHVTKQDPPYPVPISDLYFGPVLLLLGTDGNVYYDTANDGLNSKWSYSGSLPNTARLSITIAKASGGFPMNPDAGTGTLVVVAINSADGFPYLFKCAIPLSQPNANWQYVGKLPALNPAKKVVDFDIASGISALQVAYLAQDGSLYVNFQVQDGGWGVFALP